MAVVTGAQIIARTLRDLGVTVIFGIVGIPVVEIAEEAINLGIRFVAFRNEQACSYAASVYGYMTGRPGVCLVVGGPGVLHTLAGIGNATANNFPLLVLAGSAETTAITKGAFQELDAISFLTPHTKLAVRASSLDFIPGAVKNAYRTCWYGRPGPTFVDLPADIIQGQAPADAYRLPQPETMAVAAPPKASGDPALILKAAQLLKTAKAPLVIIGKGAAYARAEAQLRRLLDQAGIPFLPTPMGKGVLPDSHELNVSSARSAALRTADVVLVLGARLNWILHFGEPPKWSPSAKIIQVDLCAEEIGRNAGSAELGIVGDIGLVVDQLVAALSNWRYSPSSSTASVNNNDDDNQRQTFLDVLAASTRKNQQSAAQAAGRRTPAHSPMTYQRAFHLIKSTLDELTRSDDSGEIVYVSEGANTMDISRSIFTVDHPRQRLDAGTYATMGVGMGYIVAAHEAYNALPSSAATSKPKKIVAFEGDSAFGFSAMEIETLARYRIPALIFVVNNSGIYHGDTTSAAAWKTLQDQTARNDTKSVAADGEDRNGDGEGKRGLRSTSLLYETRYEMLATMCGGRGFLVRTEEELLEATREGFRADTVTVVNVIVEPGIGKKIGFAWQNNSGGGGEKGQAKL